ncbi:phosphoprotein associated with glycosphingolipid-enriched microdomains 1 isoform X1 [Chiloscyllium punctatum]|uniref:phosphoprotein associated with glycosphingolipid-enriched microdomains 1 isoform X1 n=2 Tax=Chiloscyllium punctatum TaxID=137246 RepID=UPI003B642ACD
MVPQNSFYPDVVEQQKFVSFSLMAPNSVDIVGRVPGVFESGQHPVILWVLLAMVCAVLLLTILVFLCSNCDRHLNIAEQNGDNENLMSVPSEKKTNSYSVTNFGNEVPVNGHADSLANGDILSDEIPNSHSSENAGLPILVNQQESSCRTSKCPQSRELPQIPGNDSIPSNESTTVTERETAHGAYEPYEVLKDSSSQDIIVEDSLYETVKELKDESGSVENEIYSRSENVDLNIVVQCQNPKLADATPEYATVSKVKMNQSTSTEEMMIGEDESPPLPVKELSENENVDGKSTEIAAMYSTVNKPAKQWSQAEAEQEGGYASIDEVTPQRRPSTASHLYASVADYEREPKVADQNPSVNVGEETDPGYEPIRALKEESTDKETESNENESQCTEGEHDYESIRELEQKQNMNNPNV